MASSIHKHLAVHHKNCPLCALQPRPSTIRGKGPGGPEEKAKENGSKGHSSICFILFVSQTPGRPIRGTPYLHFCYDRANQSFSSRFLRPLARKLVRDERPSSVLFAKAFPPFYTWRTKARRERRGTPRVTWQHAFGRHRVASYSLVSFSLRCGPGRNFCEEVSSQSGFSFTTRFRSVHRECCLQARRQSRAKSSDFPPRPSPRPLSI